MTGSFMAMDAEQKKLARIEGERGQFGAQNYRVVMPNGSHGGTHPTYEAAKAKADAINRDEHGRFAKDANPFQPDETSALQGEAGRQARKVARDCMSGRFRP